MREKTGIPIAVREIEAEKGRFHIRAFSIRGVDLAGEFSHTSETDNYTASNEMVILVDASGKSAIVTLPAASTNPGKIYYIKKTDSSGHTVTIKGNAAEETIDGDVEVELTLQYQYIMVICDGLDWNILGGEYVKMDDVLREILSVQEKEKKLLEEIKKQLEKINS